MITPNLEQLKIHRARLANCQDFGQFLEVQLAFVDLLIRILKSDEQELIDAAKEVLRTHLEDDDDE
jgi:hypothetical protein